MRTLPVLTGLWLVALCGCGDNNPNVGRARLGLKTLDKAIDTYLAAKSELPDKLEILNEKRPDGSGAYVTSNALIDPWGRPYQYDPTKRHPDTRRPLIWSDGPNPGQPDSKITNWEIKE